MIPKYARDRFLSRDLATFDWIKEYSESELHEALKELAPNHKFKRDPFPHQLASFLIGVTNPNFYFMLDMGLGKSNLILDLLSYYKNEGKLDKTLIVAPKTQHLYTWADEVAKASDLSVCILDDTTIGRAD